MYDKEGVIKVIGEENWEAFEMYMMGRKVDYDKETGFELYHPQQVSDFKERHMSG